MADELASEGVGGGGEAAVAPSLVRYRATVPTADVVGSSVPPSDIEPERYSRCPRKLGFVMLNTSTGQITPARCKANSCPYCGPINASLVGGAIALAKPERLITLTQVGEDHQTRRNRVKKLNFLLRSAGYATEWAWHVEPNPAGSGHHIHAFQRGEKFIPQALLSKLATTAGMGVVADIRRFELADDQAATYGVKMAGIKYGLKMAEQDESMRTYLGANGGRLVHASRGFWQVKGQPVGQREAMKAWASASTPSEGEWQLVAESHLSRALASVG